MLDNTGTILLWTCVYIIARLNDFGSPIGQLGYLLRLVRKIAGQPKKLSIVTIAGRFVTIAVSLQV